MTNFGFGTVGHRARQRRMHVPPVRDELLAGQPVLAGQECDRLDHRSLLFSSDGPSARFAVPDMLRLQGRSKERGSRMDLRPVREQAIEATTRFFWDQRGFAPDEDSDEWQAEYRRQFELARVRHAAGEMAAGPGEAPPPDESGWVGLRGAPTEIRWAASLRAERLKEITDREIRHWLVTT